MEIKVHSYDAGLRSVAWQDGRLVLPAAADGNQTDIGTSLHQAIEQELGKRLVGVILLGDGTQTAFQPEVEIYEAARELGNRGYPAVHRGLRSGRRRGAIARRRGRESSRTILRVCEE